MSTLTLTEIGRHFDTAIKLTSYQKLGSTLRRDAATLREAVANGADPTDVSLSWLENGPFANKCTPALLTHCSFALSWSCLSCTSLPFVAIRAAQLTKPHYLHWCPYSVCLIISLLRLIRS